MPDISLVLFIMLAVFGIVPLIGLFVIVGAIAMTFVEFLDWSDKKVTAYKNKGNTSGKRK